MSLRKRILSAIALGVLATSTVLVGQENKGQQGGRGMGSPDGIVSRLDEALTLTADQKTKIHAIYSKVQEDVRALAPADRREKGMELRQQANKDVRALLTPEQQQKFDSMPAMARGGGGGGKGPGGPGGGQGGGGKKKKDQ